ncbi:MAG: hypothetical protein H6923_00790 [Alphaproteobacteria bacterium]|nr:hypothetical protein [Alphaproteobacteria bacterium]
MSNGIMQRFDDRRQDEPRRFLAPIAWRWPTFFGRAPQVPKPGSALEIGHYSFHPRAIVKGKLDADTEAAARALIRALPAIRQAGYVQADQILINYERFQRDDLAKLVSDIEKARKTRTDAIKDGDLAKREESEEKLTRLQEKHVAARRRFSALHFRDGQVELLKAVARRSAPGLMYEKLEPIQVRGLADYLDRSGLSRFPYPVSEWADVQGGEMIFHALSAKLGNKLPEPAEKEAVAHYQVYSFNQPYLLRGFLEIRREKSAVPASVKLFQGWTNPTTGKYFAETYSGYLIAKDWNSYMVLFNASDPTKKANRVKVICLEGSAPEADGMFNKLRGASVGFGSVDLGGPVGQEVVMYREQGLVEDYARRTNADGDLVYREYHLDEVPVAEDKSTWVKVFADLSLDLDFDYSRRRGESLSIVLPTEDQE